MIDSSIGTGSSQMSDDHPFIYVASLRRTGSTLISESLTKVPYSFVFREPRLSSGRFKIKPADLKLFLEHGVDLDHFRLRWEQSPVESLLQTFRGELLPRLTQVVRQVGVKEIVHDNWEGYWRAFPDMRVVLTGRDPRDIYISLHDRAQKGRGRFAEGLAPEAVAQDLNAQHQAQREMHATVPSLMVRYEDFCKDPAVYEEMKSFVRSPIPEMGDVGRFNAENPRRTDEHELHEGSITDKRLGRWRELTDERLRADAYRTFDLMGDYCAFWGYDRE
jgi:hypothetical protein